MKIDITSRFDKANITVLVSRKLRFGMAIKSEDLKERIKDAVKKIIEIEEPKKLEISLQNSINV
jgi:hypothetical protein